MKELKLLQIKPIFIKNRRLANYCAAWSNQHWESDLTYVPISIGAAYLFVVGDGFDKEVVGNRDIRAHSKEAIKSLEKALWSRFKGKCLKILKLQCELIEIINIQQKLLRDLLIRIILS